MLLDRAVRPGARPALALGQLALRGYDMAPGAADSVPLRTP
ncbi:hypothetical protein [Streptomyces sp. NPDC088554]